MIPDKKLIEDLHKKYSINEGLFESVFAHCKITAEIALECVKAGNLSVDEQLLEAGCLLHDIGSYVFLHGKEASKVYPQHAIFGAAIITEEGIDSRISEMVKTHVLMGLSKAEIKEQGIILPHKDFEPQSTEARLLCYADRFSSKGNGLVLNSFDTFYSNLKSNLPLQAEKFKSWSKEFGLPDLQKLANKYHAKIR